MQGSDYEPGETVPCTFCQVDIEPRVHDYDDTAFFCSCGNWHHYECATQCVEYVDDLRYSAEEDKRKDFG